MDYQSVGLTPTELYEVTGYRQAAKQIHALALMGIPFKVRPDGNVFIARAWINGQGETSKPKPKPRLCLE
jgi:hypothetical protein